MVRPLNPDTAYKKRNPYRMDFNAFPGHVAKVQDLMDVWTISRTQVMKALMVIAFRHPDEIADYIKETHG